MTAVWYIGSSTEKTISQESWEAAGVTQDDTSWNASNGWSVPTTSLDAGAIEYLSEQSDFAVAQANGPRTWPFPNVHPGTLPALQSAYAYYLAVKALYDAWLSGGEDGTAINWGTLAGKPTTFPPSAHSHPLDGVTGLVDALAAKATNTALNTAVDTLTSILGGKVSGSTLTSAVNTLNDAIALKQDSSTLGTLISDAIAAAVSGLLGGATSAGNTLKKLEDLIEAITVITVPTTMPHLIKWTGDYTTGVGTWDTRPSDGRAAIWSGGISPTTPPPTLPAGDLWLPRLGDNIDLGTVVEALQMITAAANKIPYFDATNHAATLDLKTVVSGTPSDTAIVSEAGLKTYIDNSIAATGTVPDNDLGTGTTITVASSHAGKVNRLRAATAATLTIPVNATTPLPLNVPYEYFVDGAGQFTITKGNVSMTFKSAGGALKSRLQYSSFVLWQQATDVWVITGDITT